MAPHLLGLLLVGGCATPQNHWSDQLEPGGPCHRVNLLDGLDASSTDEIRDTYDCLNQSGNLAPLQVAVDALEDPSRLGIAGGREAAAWVNALTEETVDLLSLAGTLADWLSSGEAPLVTLVELGAEIIYGKPFETLAADEADLSSQAALDAGIFRPLIPVLSAAATAVLDGNLEPVEILHEGLGSDMAISAFHTLGALVESDVGQDLVIHLPGNLGNALDDVRDGSNDRWSGSTGDSLRDLMDQALTGTNSVGLGIGELSGNALRTLLSDSSLGPRMESALTELQAGDHIDEIPLQLLHFTRVDAQGGPLSSGEDSALVSMLRVLDAGNGPMTCSIIGFSVLSFDNLAVTLLEGIARLGSGATVSAVGLLGSNLLNYDLLAQAAENSSICSGITGQMVRDMEAIDRFNDPEVGDLLEVLHGVLQALYGPGTSRVPQLVDLIAAINSVGASPPLEEVLRDLGDGQLARDLIGMVPVILSPADYLDTAGFPAGVGPLDFDAVWDALGEMVALRTSGNSALDALGPVMEVALLHENTWDALNNAAPLLKLDNARIHTIIEFMPTLLDWDAEMEVLGKLTDPLLKPGVVAPLLRVVEMPSVAEALASADEGASPLAFGGALLVEGTLQTLLLLVDDLLDLTQP